MAFLNVGIKMSHIAVDENKSTDPDEITLAGNNGNIPDHIKNNMFLNVKHTNNILFQKITQVQTL